MFIDPDIIAGTTYEVNGIQYECIGYAQNSTLLIIGVSYDNTSNRSSLVTHKLSEVKFLGKLTKT